MNSQPEKSAQPDDWSSAASPFQTTLEILRALPEEFNAAIKLDHQLSILESAGRLPLMTLISLRPKMERAFAEGRREIERVSQTLSILRRLPSIPRMDRTPDGF